MTTYAILGRVHAIKIGLFRKQNVPERVSKHPAFVVGDLYVNSLSPTHTYCRRYYTF
ncbi:hypothetical protein Plhal304r1_c003g0011271 [Plasmopara halstedii]